MTYLFVYLLIGLIAYTVNIIVFWKDVKVSLEDNTTTMILVYVAMAMIIVLGWIIIYPLNFLRFSKWLVLNNNSTQINDKGST
jgi:bacteriorhodopsin